MIYLTGHSSAAVRSLAWSEPLGLLAQPSNGYAAQVPDWPRWAADNGCFALGAQFDCARYLRWLGALAPHADRCLFAVAPDVVGDAAATLARSGPVLPELRARGFRSALAGQDGLEALAVPWDAFDVFFIGGTTTWKLSPTAAGLAREAKRRGKWVHMGRVNSGQRLAYAALIGCDSVDGTYLAFGPDKNLPRLMAWLTQPTLPLAPAAEPPS